MNGLFFDTSPLIGSVQMGQVFKSGSIVKTTPVGAGGVGPSRIPAASTAASRSAPKEGGEVQHAAAQGAGARGRNDI